VKLTVDEILQWANGVVVEWKEDGADWSGFPRLAAKLDVARSLLSLFRTPLPCGWPTPRPAFADGGRDVTVEWGGVGVFSADDACGVGVVLILAAEGERR
jgi:hypothetical protein